MSGSAQPESQQTNIMETDRGLDFLRPVQLEPQQQKLFQSGIKTPILETLDYSTIGKETIMPQINQTPGQSSLFGDGKPNVNLDVDEVRPKGGRMSIEATEEEKKENKTDDKVAVEQAKGDNELPKDYLMYDTNLIDRQNEEIRMEIEKDSPLISDVLPLDMLEFEFTGNEGFLKKIPVFCNLISSERLLLISTRN